MSKSSLIVFLSLCAVLAGKIIVLAQDDAADTTATATTTNTATTTTEVTPALCFGNFVALNFSFNDYERYPVFFHDDSVFTNPYAGAYQGAENIKEYTRFVGLNTTFVDVVDGISTPSLTSISPEGVCEILLLTQSWYEFNPEHARGIGYNLTVMSKIHFNPIENFMEEFILYLPPMWMDSLFGEALGTSRTHEFICDVMADKCPDTWELNLPTLEENAIASDIRVEAVAKSAQDQDGILKASCVDKLAKLPITDAYYIDGNSYGCRALHAAFAMDNDHHCTHISFVPQEDEDGNIKCQESAQKMASDYFTEEDFAKFDTFQMEHADVVDIPQGYKVLYMEDMSNATVATGTEETDNSSAASELYGTLMTFLLASASLLVLAF